MVLDGLFNSPVRIAIAEFLQIEVFRAGPVVIDLWGLIIHFFAGMIIMFILINYNWEKKLGVNRYWILLIFLYLYEIVEWAFFLSDSRFFIPETVLDSLVLDIVWGMLGGLVVDFAFRD